MKSFVDRIRENRSELSPSFDKLADYLLDSYAHAALLSATEIGHSLDIDTATVVRFAQYLGYKGFPELQREIRDKLRKELLEQDHHDPNSSAEAVELALKELIHSLDLTRRSFSIEHAEAMISALDETQRVIILAEGLAYAPARNLAAWLEAAGYNIHLAGGSLSDLARAIAGARKGDMVLAIEVDENNPYLYGAIAEAKASGIITGALVSEPSSPAASQADHVLAAYQTPLSGAGQILVEAVIFAFMRMLTYARPGRFQNHSSRVAQLKKKILEEKRL
jgi:DNA-binding MurR/RpiR family transcriptional regulator